MLVAELVLLLVAIELVEGVIVELIVVELLLESDKQASSPLRDKF